MRFPYISTDTSLMPRLPFTLVYEGRSLEVLALLDTGSSVNVLPYSIGLALGAIWEDQKVSLPLTGSLGRFEARVLMLMGSHPQLTPDGSVRLAFAWVQTDDAPLLFGQTNFFMEFDVCFCRAQGEFDVHRKVLCENQPPSFYRLLPY